MSSRLPVQEILTFWFGDSCAAPPRDFRERFQFPDKPQREIWFSGGEATDRRIREAFGELAKAEQKRMQGLDRVRAVQALEAEGLRTTLARILLLDQFSRNVFRDDSRAFDGDPAAQILTRAASDLLEARPAEASKLRFVELAFVWMPCMHAEDLRMQELGERRFAELRDAVRSALQGQAGSDGATTAVVEAAEVQPLLDMLGAFVNFAGKHADVIRRFGRFPHRNAVLGRASLPEEERFLREEGRGF